MKTSTFRILSAGVAMLAVVSMGSGIATSNGYAADKLASTEKTVNLPTRAELLGILPDDRAIGAQDAPVTIIEYASMSCGHCATFHNETFKQIKTNYIDTGKVRFAFRNFPLNREAVLGATVAYCAPEEKYHHYISALFASQSEWLAGDTKQKLKAIAMMGGMSDEEYNDCIENKDISENIILKGRFDASKTLSIRSTPTFFINGVMHEGAKDYEFFKRAIDTQLEKYTKSETTTIDTIAVAPLPDNQTAKKEVQKAEEAVTNASKTLEDTEGTDAQPTSMTTKIIDKVKATATDIKTTLTGEAPLAEAATKDTQKAAKAVSEEVNSAVDKAIIDTTSAE